MWWNITKVWFINVSFGILYVYEHAMAIFSFLNEKKQLGKSRAAFMWAENETRTRDPNLGKVVLYQLSYFRNSIATEIAIENKWRGGDSNSHVAIDTTPSK